MGVTRNLTRDLVRGLTRGLTDDFFTPAFSLTAPVLTWVSDASDNTPLFEGVFTDLQVGDVGRLQISTDVGFTSPTTLTNTADSAEVLALQLDYTSGGLADGTYWVRVRHERGAMVSAWSNIETKTIATTFNVLTALFGASEKGGWWDSSDLTTLKQLSNGTTAVAVNNDPVGYWADKTTNANHLIQATAGKRPLYTTSFGVKGDGIDDILKRTLSATISNTTMWVAMAIRIESIGGGYRRAVSLSDTVGGVDSSSAPQCIPLTNVAGISDFAGYRGGQLSTAALVAAIKYCIESKFDGANNTLTVNGSAASAVGSTGSFGCVALTVFGATSDSDFGNYSIAELIVRDSVPTSQQILDCRAYLTTKWGV